MAECGEWFIVADREWVVTFDDRLHRIGTDFIELEAARSHPLLHGTAIARCGGWGDLTRVGFLQRCRFELGELGKLGELGEQNPCIFVAVTT